MRKIHFIGCGRVGKTLGKLWLQHAIFFPGQIVTRSIESAESAVAFIGSGKAITDLTDLKLADVFFLASSDDQLEGIAKELAASGVVQPGNIVFHCSGVHPSECLQCFRERGAFVASVHPVKSFASPENAVASFSGTFCSVEGDLQAIEILEEAFSAIGGWTARIDSKNKTLCHLAPVIASNYLVALLELSLQVYDQVGLERNAAIKILEPLVCETVQNVMTMGSVEALTGPISRGDGKVVKEHLDAIKKWKPEYAKIYADLGEVALQLARARGSTSPDSLQNVETLLKDVLLDRDLKEFLSE